MSESTIGERLRELLATLRISQTAFAQEIGVSQSAISQTISNKTGLKRETLSQICERFNVDANWLTAGRGAMFLGAPPPPPGPGARVIPITVDAQNEPTISLVPVKAQAGYAAQRVEPAYWERLPGFFLPYPEYRQGTYRAFEVSGDSMEPTLYQGDALICSHVEEIRWIRDRSLYVFVVDGDVLVKRAVNRMREAEPLVELHSDNTYYTPLTLRPEELVEVWAVEARLTRYLPAPAPPARA